MQIVETTNEGLKRAYQLIIPARDIDARIDAEVKKVAPQVRMPGFRPGKVPANLVRKIHGEALHADALNNTVRESIDALMRDKALRPALQPKVEMADGYAPGKDAELTVELEVLPEITAPSVDGLKLERLTVPVADEQVEEALSRIAGQQKSYVDAPEGHAAESGDQVIIDFVGRLGEEEFAGGKADDAALVLGSGQFIPGFEDQLIGAKAGDERVVAVTFPEDYPADNLKGQAAEFSVKVKAVKRAGETVIDEEFAKNLGLESLDKLRELVRGQLEQELAGLTRTQMKRQLLDQLAAAHDFAVPQTMVEAEFEQIWRQLEAETRREADHAAAMAEIEAERDDYRRIAERRVRLGLLLSEIGQANGVEISQQEMQMLIAQAAQQYRQEDRQRFIDFIRSDAMAQAQLRAPLYEDKVVDFLFDKAEVTERTVTREELEAAIEAEEGLTQPVEAEEKPKAKAGGRKAKAEAAPADAAASSANEGDAAAAGEDAAAKKPAARKSKAKSAEATPEAGASGAEGGEDNAKPAKKATCKKAASE